MGFKMARASELLTDLVKEDEVNVNDLSHLTSSQLISSLKSTFISREFALVERVVVARETTLKLEIERLEKENELIKEKHEGERLEKMGIENELKKHASECWGLKQINSHLSEEKRITCEREMCAEERCRRLLEDMKRIGEEDETIVELRSKNCELECAKGKAESEVQIWKRRFKELETRVLQLERDYEILMNVETNVSMNGGVCGSQGVGEKRVSENSVVCGGEEIGERRVSENGAVENENIGVGNGKSAGDSARADVKVQLIDCEDVANVESKVNRNGTDCNETEVNLEAGVVPSCCSPVKTNGRLQCAGAERPPPESIIEIIDSDDDCTPGGILGGKGTTLQGLAESVNSGETSAQNGTRMLKRKVASNLNVGENVYGDDDDDNYVKKLKESVCEPDGSPLNHCSATAVCSASNDTERFFTPSRQDASVRRSEGNSGVKSQNLLLPLLSGSESSDSEDSSSSSDDEFDLDVIINT